MPKRKAEICGSGSLSITSLDAALDMLACDTFTRLQTITSKFEAAAGIKLNEGVIRNRWDEAVRRYWVMKGMDDLVCTARKAFSAPEKAEEDGDEVKMEDGNEDSAGDARRDQGGRLLPDHEHPGAPVVHKLSEEEEQEWRRWTPKTGDPVLVELSDDSIWPGKIIDKKTYFQGRTQPRGNHFFAVRLYCEDMQPTVTIKSRLLPLQMRPNPPLLASTNVLSAFNHATNPATFDLTAQARESLAAHRRTHPGVSGEPDKAKVKAEKTAWNELVNWVMSERRVEKLRALDEERKKRLQAIAQESDFLNGEGEARCMDRVDDCPKRRRMTATVPLPPTDSPKTSRANSPASSIFGPAASASTPKRMASPALASFIRPALSTPQRPHSPRRVGDRRRSVYTGVGEYSPRGRGATYTPPRVLPTGDETAFYASGSPAPSLQTFDFVSPLGPVRLGRLDSEPTYPKLQRKGSLEAVKEEATETEDGWTVVKGKRGKRAGSLPALEKKDGIESSDLSSAREEMTVDA